MSRTFPLRLPESIRRAAEDLARQHGVSLNQFAATVVAER
jgi:predicted HicB family RNase H-like nuclease